MKKKLNHPVFGPACLLRMIIVFSLLSFQITFAQSDFDLLTLAGTYEGYLFDAGKGEQDKTAEVTVELAEDFTFSLYVNSNGSEHDINQRLKPKQAAMAQNGSLEVNFEFAHTNSAFTEVIFSLLPESLGYEGIFLSLKDEDNKFLIIQLNKQGGNPLIPGAAEGLTGRELEKELHRQFGALFADSEKGFASGGVEEEGQHVYPSGLHITHTKPASIYKRDSGVHYYFTQIKMSSGEDKWAYRDSLIEAIESYPSSDGVRIEPVSIRDENKIYAVTQFREPYGFIQFKEVDDKWFIRLFIPLDPIRLEEELTSGFEMAENMFTRIQGEKIREFTFLEHTTSYESKRIFYGADTSSINRFESRCDWISSFKNYPYAVLAYQLREMDLTFPGVTRAAYEKGEGRFFQRYEKPHMAFEITLEDTGAGYPKLWLSRKKNTNPPVYVAPVKTYAPTAEYPAFSGQYEGDDLYALMGRHWDDPAIKKWLMTREYGFKKSKIGDAEYCTYDAYGVWLTFSKCHLSEINLFNTKLAAFGSFNGKLPKGLQWNTAAESISSAWRQERGGFKVFQENGITTRLRFSAEDPDKLDEITIRKPIIADAREDIEQDKVGVGLGYSVNKAGKVSVRVSTRGYAAAKAGINGGAWILEIDGTPVQGKDKYDVDRLLKGKLGSAVKVKFCPRYEEENAKEYVLFRGAGGRAERLIPAVSYPPFNGVYEGDDLFQLLDREFSDPAITVFIKRIFMRRVHVGTNPNQKTIQGTDIGLDFYTNKLTKISLNAYFFEGKLPQGLDFESSPAEMKTSNQLNWSDEGNPYMTADYNERVQLRVEFDENSDVEGAQSTFVHLMLKPENKSLNVLPAETTQAGEDLVELGFKYGQGKDSDIYEVDWLVQSSAAYIAGVRRDDNVIKINGTPITGMPFADVKKIMLGKRGTTAIVVVERDGNEIECTVVR